MLNKLFRAKVVRFLFGGGVSAAINLLLIFCLIELLDFNTPFLRNLANAVAIELSLLASFFIYRIWVWTGGAWNLREVLWRQLPLYHVAAGSAVFTRILIIFPLLDRLGVNYGVNTLIGVCVSAVLNYLISDRLVFKNRAVNYRRREEFPEEIYHPEGLSPALETSFSSSSSLAKSKKPIELFSILIPAYNEDGSIISTVEAISKVLTTEKIPYEILVVNDNSRDRTETVLRQLSSHNRQVRYINNYYPNGFGFAVRCGLENFQGDAVAVVMADSSDQPENIVDYYYQLQQGYDCVFGSRFIRGGKVIDYPKYKLGVNRLANLFIQILFGIQFNDTTNAFKAYRREVIHGISPLLSHHFNLTVEMPLKSIIRGYSYATIPITWQNRAEGMSKLRLNEMGSRYLFIVLCAWLEKHLTKGDYRRSPRLLTSKSKI